MKHPPATDATPEELARAALRRRPSSADREKDRKTSDASASLGEERESPEARSSAEAAHSATHAHPNEPDPFPRAWDNRVRYS